MTHEYVSANDAERARLDALLSRLTDRDLALTLPNGLSVAATLVHLAFWDRYAQSALESYRDSGFVDSQTNFEAINSALLVLAAAIPVSQVIEMARAAAQAVDAEAEAVSPELARTIEDAGKRRTLERAQHRRVHVDQIEQRLSTSQ